MSIARPGSKFLSHGRPCEQPQLQPATTGPAAQVSSPSHLTAIFNNACTNIKTYSWGFQHEKCAWLNPLSRKQGCSYSQSKTTQSLKMASFFPVPRPHFSLDVRTRAAEGLLFFATTRGGRSHLALYISKGRIRLSVGRQKEIFNREKYNDGKWHSVSGLDEITQPTLTNKAKYYYSSAWWLCCRRSYSVWRRRNSDWLWMGSEPRMVS